MNKVVTSREEILAATRALAAANGIADVGIRAVANACGISIGSVYYYFLSKDDLILALVEDVWRGILSSPSRPGTRTHFLAAVGDLFRRIRKGSADFPSFFTLHPEGFGGADRNAGRRTMVKTLAGIQADLAAALEADGDVRQELFTGPFTREAFVSFVFSSMMAALGEGKPDCDTLLEVIRLAVYRG